MHNWICRWTIRKLTYKHQQTLPLIYRLAGNSFEIVYCTNLGSKLHYIWQQWCGNASVDSHCSAVPEAADEAWWLWQPSSPPTTHAFLCSHTRMLLKYWNCPFARPRMTWLWTTGYLQTLKRWPIPVLVMCITLQCMQVHHNRRLCPSQWLGFDDDDSTKSIRCQPVEVTVIKICYTTVIMWCFRSIGDCCSFVYDGIKCSIVKDHLIWSVMVCVSLIQRLF